MTEESRLQPGDLIAGKYEVRRLIGQGGMGAVHEVEHQITKRVGALKMLHPEFAQMASVVERFIREASAAGRIGSPHIIETYDAGVLDEGVPYIFMEFLQGQNLEDLVEHNGPLDPREAVDLIRQACKGLDAAHRAGIVHRDIKPENLFLTGGAEPLVKILDFGISKFDPALTNAGKMTVEGQSIGTPHYMSPEQVMGRTDVDGRTDVYSLGVTLYFMLTGELPYQAETLPAMSVLIVQGHCATVAQHRPDLPLALSEVVSRAMAVDRDDRFPGMDALAGALAPFSNHGDERADQVTQPLATAGTDRTILSEPPVTHRKGSAPLVISIPPNRPPNEGLTPGRPQEVSSGTVSPVTDTLPGVAAKDPKSRAPLIAGVLVAIGALGLGLILLSRGANPKQDVDSASAEVIEPSADDEPSPAHRDVEPASVAIFIEGAPDRATVSYQGALVTGNPFRVPSAQVNHPLVVEAEGYEPYSIMVVPSEDRQLTVNMKPIATPASPSPRGQPPPPKAAAPKPSGDLKKGRLGSQFTSEFE